jgi:hypothetical protein
MLSAPREDSRVGSERFKLTLTHCCLKACVRLSQANEVENSSLYLTTELLNILAETHLSNRPSNPSNFL